jgi:hypothetical protein
VRIDTLTYSNVQMQGARRREWLREHSPRHMQQCAALMLHALQQRRQSASRSILVLGAGACTEIPLSELVRASDEVVLADLDLTAMQQAQAELSSPAQRRSIRLVACDIGGGVSASLNRLIEQQSWQKLVPRGAQAVFDAAADCLEHCPVPDPPQLEGLGSGEFGVVISSLVLSQLFSYPLLDILDHVQQIAPNYVGEQEQHRRYKQAAQEFRLRVISAHLDLLRKLVDVGGMVVLISDVRGFVFEIYGSELRRSIPLVPRKLPELVRALFTVIEEADWEWLTDLPEGKKLGRGYEVVGYLLGLPG